MSETQTDRRTFYLTFVYGLTAIISMALAIPAALYLLLPTRSKKQAGWVDAGSANQLKPDQPQEMQFRRTRVDGWKVSTEKASAWVVQIPNQGIVAYSPSCTHLGCAYHWEESKKVFFCPCHTSAFSIDGKVLSGPAPRALDRYAVRVDHGHIMLGELHKSSNA